MSAKRTRPAKVPVILQMEALESGAASLCMVLAYYKKWLSLDVVRYECGVSRDGSTAENISAAAQSYGLDVKTEKTNVSQLMQQGEFPCIIWWNYNHFVVLDGFAGDSAVLNDPAMGRVTVSKEEFEESYSNLCIMLKPGENFVPGGKPKSMVSYFLERAKGNGKSLILIVVTAALAAVAGIIIPSFNDAFTNILSQNSTQNIHSDKDSTLTLFLFVFGFFILYHTVCQLFNIISIYKASGKIAVVSNFSFLWHLLRLPMDFFSQRYAGDLTSRQTENDKVAKTLVQIVVPTCIQIVLLFFYLFVMIKVSVELTFVGLLTVAANLFIARYISKKRTDISRVQLRDMGKLNAATVSAIDMVETIKASGAENGFFERWSGFHASAMKSKVAFGRVNQYLGSLPDLVQQVSTVIMLALGASLIIGGYLGAGAFLTFQALMNSFLKPVNMLITAGQNIQEMRSYAERIEDVMKYPAEEDAEEEDPALQDLKGVRKLSGNVELKNITFGYSRLAEPLIKDFSLSVRPGAKVALIGSSGSGKSTIAKLIAGLYDPWSGSITFDGKKRREIPKAVFTASVSVVDQDVAMFADTIENNIKMWDTTIENYDMILAARDADIHDDIIQKRGGYHYVIAENGKDLSGGQRQRLEIARVLAGDPSLIIMDEATSALDAKTEYLVSEAIKARGITCIIVAHRLSTIRDCDEIIVLDNGVVAERGDHDTLMAKNGLYAELITTQ